jgi:hypothetical protein
MFIVIVVNMFFYKITTFLKQLIQFCLYTLAYKNNPL